MAESQNLQNHTRFDPKFHLSLIPLLLFNFIGCIVWTVRHSDTHLGLGLWAIAMACVLIWMALVSRLYALHNQDRTIRLEERLRYALLLPEAELPLLQGLTLPQRVALRFASDAELPTLALRAANEKLTPKQIKQSITSWRADTFRI